MMPLVTLRAVRAFLAGFATLTLGIVASSPPVAVVGVSIFVALALAYAAAAPQGRKIRRERLEFAWWVGDTEGVAKTPVVVTGAPFALRCLIRQRGAAPILLEQIEIVAFRNLTVVDRDPTRIFIPARSRSEFEIVIAGSRVGNLVLHGLKASLRGPFGLFTTPLYFPNPLRIVAVPRAASLPLRFRSAGGRIGSDIAHASRRALAGEGDELRELRHFHPGDPFRSIAWKASARAGELVVRELERHVPRTVYVVVDASLSGASSEDALDTIDVALEQAARESRAALRADHRVGLLVTNGRIVTSIKPDDRRTQTFRIFDALVAATEPVDSDLTDIDDERIIELVGNYVRHQDGVDFSKRAANAEPKWDVVAMIRHVSEHTRRVPLSATPRATSSALRILRSYCRLRGLALSPPSDPHGARALGGLLEGLREVLENKSATDVVVIADFARILDVTRLIAMVKLLRARGLTVEFRSVSAIPAVTLNADLRTSFERAYHRRVQRRSRIARRLLGRTGARLAYVTRQASDRH